MIVIQQAIYGEVKGRTIGHDLLCASNERSDLFKRVSGVTDLADRPEGGVLSSPVVRGVFAEEHFLLIKYFPDTNPIMRHGRVFAHTLFIRKTDLHQVSNLFDLFRHHLPGIQKEAEMLPIEYHPHEDLAALASVDGRQAAATNALLQNNPFVWLGEEGYWQWISRIWPQLPSALKKKLKIGAAFGPTYAKSEHLNLLYIPEDAKALWERHEFRVIDKAETETLQTPDAQWLAGNSKEGAPFETLLVDFAPKIDSIDLINRLQSHGKVYHRLDQNQELRSMLVLSHFISRVNPNGKSGTKGKSALLAAILDTLPKATVQQIAALIDQSWQGFQGAIASVSDAVSDWLTNHLLHGNQANECGVVLVKALERKPKNWWSDTVLEYVKKRLSKRQANDALIIWNWMIKEPTLIAQHALWLPNDAEGELSQEVPKLEKSIAEAVLNMAKQKGWLVLHAKMAAQFYSAKRAIEAQLRIDTDEDHFEALEALSVIIKESLFVNVAANHTDTRLHRIAGKLITGNSKLLNGIDIASDGWQQCWEAAIEHGAPVWSGLSDPQYTLFEILDRLLAGNSFSGTLLDAMSNAKQSSLKDYPKRASIWPELPAKARSRFIASTLEELLDDFASGQLQYNDLEIELKNGVQSKEFLQQIILSNCIQLVKKIHLFDVLPELGAKHARQLIEVNSFSRKEAEQFGQLVFKNNWKAVADALYDQRAKRNDLVPALVHCSNLLGFLKRLGLSVSGLKPDAISPDEWWETFFSRAVELYPLGPTQNGLWLNAGGKIEELHFQGVSGKQSWSFAIDHIRKGGSPSTEKLVKEMRKEYYRDTILAQLVQVL